MKKIHNLTWAAAFAASLGVCFPAKATITNIVCNAADYTCQPSGVNNSTASTTDAIGFAGSPGSSWSAVIMVPLPTLPAGKQIGPQTTFTVTLNSIGAGTTINGDLWGIANFRTTLPSSPPDSSYSYFLNNDTGPGNNSTASDVKLVNNFLTPSLIGKPGVIVSTPTGTTNNLQNYIQSFYANNPTYDASVSQAYVWFRINPDSASTSTANRYVINAGDSGVSSTIRPTLNLDIADIPASSVTWNGNVSAVWDLNTTANWKSNNITGLTYQDGASVIFDDTLTGNPAVTLNTTVSPASVLANNNVAYSISGSGKISGSTALIKAGTNTLIMDTDNDYSGGTLLAGGTLQIGNGDTHGSLGSGPVTNTVAGAVLAFNRTDTLNVGTVTRQYQYNAFVVVNSGTVFLGGAGDNSGTLAMVNNGGTLVLGKASGSTAHALGSSSSIAAGGVMQLGGSGGDQIFQNAYLTNNGTFDLAGLNEGINGMFGNGVVTNTVAAASTLALGDGNGTAIFSGIISDGAGTVAVTKTGTGTQTLTATNTYSGGTHINAGKLVVVSGSLSRGDYTVADSAILGVNVVSANSTYSISNLTVGNSKIDVQILNSSTAAPLSVSNLTVNGTVTIDIASTNTFFPSQSYPLIAYNNLSGGGSFALGTLPTGVSGTLDTSSSPIKFVVASVPVTWNGNVSGAWDINTTPNWKFGTLTGLTYPDGDAVTFDDTLSGTPAITLDTVVNPLSVTFSNTTHSYSLSGAGYISGNTQLTKTGTNTLIVDTDNDYIGGTTLLGGTLQVGNNDTHGTLGFGNVTNLTGGAIIAFNRTDSIHVGTITRTTVDNSARLVINSGTVYLEGTGDNSGTMATVNSGGTLVLNKDSSASIHALSSLAPFLQINSGGVMQLGGFGGDQIYQSSGLTDNGTFDMAGLNEGFDMLNGTGVVTSSSGSSTLELGQNNGSSTFAGAILDASGNTLSLSKVGTGTLTLTGTNNYTGNTTLSAGKLIVSTASTGDGLYTVSDSAAFGVSVASPNGSLAVNSLTLGSAGATTLEFQNLNSTTTAAINAPTVTASGVVTVNITSGSFVAGQNYPLLSYGTLTGGSFALGTLPPGLQATLNSSASPITLHVISTVNPNPTNIVAAFTNGTITLQWPADHTGWLLQSNSVDLGNSNDWFTVPGSDTTNLLTMPINSDAPFIFYRLRF